MSTVSIVYSGSASPLRFTAAQKGESIKKQLPVGVSTYTRQRSLAERTIQIYLTFIGIVPGSDVVVLSAGTTTVLDTGDSISGSTYTFSYSTLGNVDIGILKSGYKPLYIRDFTLTTSGGTLPIAQTIDRNYI